MISGQVDAAGMRAFAAKSVADRNPKRRDREQVHGTHRVLRRRGTPGDFDLLQFLRTWVFLNKHNGVLAGIYQKNTGVRSSSCP